MSTGFTDWNVPININAQALAEIINRPKYGTVQALTYSDTILTNDEVTLGSVSGKGQIYGGYLWGAASASQTVVYIKLYFDDVLVQADTPKTFHEGGIILPNTSIIFGLRYDPFGFGFTVGFSSGVTFEESFKISIIRHPGVACSVSLKCFYAIV